MKASKENIGGTYKARFTSYKSVRHYGGRDITPYNHIAEVTLVDIQRGYQPYVVILNADMKDYKGRVQFKKGHKVAVSERDFDI